MEREHTVNLKLTNGAECICNPEILLGTNYGLWDFKNEIAPRGTLLDLNAAWELFLSKLDFDLDVTFRETHYDQAGVENILDKDGNIIGKQNYEEGDTKYTLYDGDTPTRAYFVIKANKGPVEHIEWLDGYLILYYTKTRPVTDEDLLDMDGRLPIHYVYDEQGNKVVDQETGRYLIYDYVKIPVIEIFDNDETHTLFPWFADSQHTVRLRQNLDDPEHPDNNNQDHLGDVAITSNSEVFIAKTPYAANTGNTLISVQSLFDTIKDALGINFTTSAPDNSIVDEEGSSSHIRATGTNLASNLLTDDTTSIVSAINSIQDFSEKLHELIDGHNASVGDNHSLGLNNIFETNNVSDNIVEALNFIQVDEIGDWLANNNIRYFDSQTNQYVAPETITDAINLIFDKAKANSNRIGYDRTNHRWIPLNTDANNNLTEAINEVDTHVNELASRAGLVESNHTFKNPNLNTITKNRLRNTLPNDNITIIEAINELLEQIGNLDEGRSRVSGSSLYPELRTDEKTNLVKAINEVDTHADLNRDRIGWQNNAYKTLDTDAKGNLTDAINELVSKIGPLDSLPTDDLTSIVNSIQELESEMPIIYSNTSNKENSGLIHRALAANGSDTLHNVAGSLSLVIGSNNKAGAHSFISGTGNNTNGNITAGDYNLISGLNNISTGHYSSVFGNNNIVTGDNQFVNGTQNMVYGSNNFISGATNLLSLNSTNITIFGVSNTVNCNNVSILGNSNTIALDSTNVFVAGYNNTVSNAQLIRSSSGVSIALGYLNTIGGSSVAIGLENTVYDSGRENYIIGEYNGIRGSNNIVIGFSQSFAGNNNTVIASNGLTIPANTTIINNAVIINGKNNLNPNDTSGDINQFISGATHIGQDIYIKTHNSQSKLLKLIAVDLNDWCRDNSQGQGLLNAGNLFPSTALLSNALITYARIADYDDKAILRFRIMDNGDGQNENGFALVQDKCIRVYLRGCLFYHNLAGGGWSRHEGEYLDVVLMTDNNGNSVPYLAIKDQLTQLSVASMEGALKTLSSDLGTIDLRYSYGAMPLTRIYDALGLLDKFNSKVDKTAKINVTYRDGNGLTHTVEHSFIDNLNPNHTNDITIDLDEFGLNLGNVLFKDEKGIANGYTPLNLYGQIDSQYLPSYVDDVVDVWAEYTVLANGALADIHLWEIVESIDPQTQQTVYSKGRIYSTTTDNLNIQAEVSKIYVEANPNSNSVMTALFRWTGTRFVPIGYLKLVLGREQGTAFDGGAGAQLESDLQDHLNSGTTYSDALNTIVYKPNPHNVNTDLIRVTLHDPNNTNVYRPGETVWVEEQNNPDYFNVTVHLALQELFDRIGSVEDYSNPVFTILGTPDEILEFDNLGLDEVDEYGTVIRENPTVIGELMSYHPILVHAADEHNATASSPSTIGTSVESLVNTYFNIDIDYNENGLN